MKRLARFFEKMWYDSHPIQWLLWPISCFYRLVTWFRCLYLINFCQVKHAVPVIVVGNISVGGVGKTPLVIALAKEFLAKGLRVGIVSRGYGAAHFSSLKEVSLDDNASKVGDEPLLLAKKTKCPVVISKKRNNAIKYLMEKYQSEIIISDDGLQHYAMGRTIEIAVIDGMRGVGNGMCLPAGPLREGLKRLKHVDFIVINGASNLPVVGNHSEIHRMDLLPGRLTQLKSGKTLDVEKEQMAAVAAIGNPERFFATLSALNISFTKHPFPDHYAFVEKDLLTIKEPIVMTEKDAVKCLPFATDGMYFLPVEASLSSKFWESLWSCKKLNMQ